LVDFSSDKVDLFSPQTLYLFESSDTSQVLRSVSPKLILWLTDIDYLSSLKQLYLLMDSFCVRSVVISDIQKTDKNKQYKIITDKREAIINK